MPESVPGLSRLSVPVILQQERAECGLACLAMVATYFGRETSLPSLREQNAQAGHGATFQELLGVAQSLRLIARPLRLSLDEIAQLQLPAILHWRMNHFVVLTAIGRRRVTIHDPATGKRVVDRAEFDESFTGVALEFTRRHDFVLRKGRRKLTFSNIVGSFTNLYRYLSLMLALLIVRRSQHKFSLTRSFWDRTVPGFIVRSAAWRL